MANRCHTNIVIGNSSGNTCAVGSVRETKIVGTFGVSVVIIRCGVPSMHIVYVTISVVVNVITCNFVGVGINVSGKVFVVGSYGIIYHTNFNSHATCGHVPSLFALG